MNEVIAADQVVDFQGVPCPFNYVKTKLVLEEMAIGQVLEVTVDAGEPERHVPKSITNDGQEVLSQFTDDDGRVHIVIKKTVDY